MRIAGERPVGPCNPGVKIVHPQFYTAAAHRDKVDGYATRDPRQPLKTRETGLSRACACARPVTSFPGKAFAPADRPIRRGTPAWHLQGGTHDMARILLVGGFPDDAAQRDDVASFIRALAAEVIKQGHKLLGGCQTPLDREAAIAAEAAVRALDKSPDDYIISYVGKGSNPIHTVGSVRQSALPRWDLIGHRLVYPEPVMLADAVITIAGWEGTHRAANWARIAAKPLLPIATFGLAAEDIYRSELDEFEVRYASKVSRNEYEQLNRVLPERSSEAMQAFAVQVVALAERIMMPRDVFVVMSFGADPDLEDAYETFCSACAKYSFHAFRIDHHIDETKRIVHEVIENIRRCAFVIADVSEPKPNVYYELGWAQALGKPVIVTAKEGVRLEFDIYDVPTIYWKNQKTLREGLAQRLERIAEKFGRQSARGEHQGAKATP